MRITAVDLFCGSGGLSAGLMESGIEVSAAFDNWDIAVNTYSRNLPCHAYVLDLSEPENAIPEITAIAPTVIAGGPPCQDFSTAGKRVEGGRANLTTSFAKIVSECSPPFFLMENVTQVRFSQAYGRAKETLRKKGYEIAEIVLDASRCGVPQARKRFFAFGSLDSREPKDMFLESVSKRVSGERMTVKEYLGDEIDIEFYYRHPRNYSRRSVFSVHEPSPTIRGVNRPVPPNYERNHLDSACPSKVRPLTSLERSRIQTFPESWDWNAGDRNADAELQIGNAVPVELATFIGTGIADAAESL